MYSNVKDFENVYKDKEFIKGSTIEFYPLKSLEDYRLVDQTSLYI